MARCWLVDPPANAPGDPERFKTVTRLRYIVYLISLIAPRSLLAATLQTRIDALDALEDISPLNERPLVKGDGEEFSYETFRLGGRHNPLFQAKSVVSDGPAGGQIYPVGDYSVLYVGIQEKLVAYVSQQSFHKINSYSFPAGTVRKTLNCVVPQGRFKRQFVTKMNIPKTDLSESGGYVYFDREGSLRYTQSGLIFGVLIIPRKWQVLK